MVNDVFLSTPLVVEYPDKTQRTTTVGEQINFWLPDEGQEFVDRFVYELENNGFFVGAFARYVIKQS